MLFDVNMDNKLDFSEVRNIFQFLNINYKHKKEDIMKHFVSINKKKSDKLRFSEFHEVITKLKERDDINDLFKRFTTKSDSIGFDQFKNFVLNTQCVTLYKYNNIDVFEE
jgi:Ca2+-binding EF-hand superfamily protein